jgi:catechol 2,3-dioxygenase-like lactoylglutathione lyase family enzyme
MVARTSSLAPMKPVSLVPMAYVRSVERSIAFYRLLGFEEGNRHTPEGQAEPAWAWLKAGGAQLMVSAATEPVEPEKQAVLFYIYCDDVAAFREQLMRAQVNAGPIQHPFWSPGGEFRVVDPDGYVLMISHT